MSTQAIGWAESPGTGSNFQWEVASTVRWTTRGLVVDRSPCPLQLGYLTKTMWPVEMSMLGCTGSSDHEDVLLRAEGLGIGSSLNCEEVEWMRDVCSDGRPAIRCLHSSCKTCSRQGRQRECTVLT